jgi:hypothetical protein
MDQWLIFAAAMWLFSRLFIATAMLLITPLLQAPPGGISPQLAGKSSTCGIVYCTTKLPLQAMNMPMMAGT